MAFSISFVDDAVEDGIVGRYGVLQLGDYSERFLASLEFWSAEQYEQHWRDALKRICANDANSEVSALITSLRDPDTTIGVFWWPMYRIAGRIYVQNALRLFNQLPEPFDLTNPYAAVPARTVSRDDGDTISEWIVNLEDVCAFLRAQERR
jgi:hypothetical protein